MVRHPLIVFVHMNKAATLIAIATVLVSCRSPSPIGRPNSHADILADAPDSAVADPSETGDFGTGGPRDDVSGRDGSGVQDSRWDDQDGAEPDLVPADAAAEDAPAHDGGPDATGTPIPRPCEITLSYRPQTPASSVTVPGEWNGWDKAAHPMQAGQDGTWSVTLGPGDVPPGEWGYKFLVDGTTWVFDPMNPLVKYVGADFTENSRLIVPDCEAPLLTLISARAEWTTRTLDIVVQAYTGVSGQPLDPASLRVERAGAPFQGFSFDPATQRFTVHLEDVAPGKHSFVFRAANAHGEAVPLFVPVWMEERPFSWRDAVLYFAMTDRFHDGDPDNDQPAACLPPGHKANWLGGDFAGIREKIEEGYFESLGVNAIWISPANANPPGCFPGDLGLQYTAYHGYFPVSLDQTDAHFGDLSDLHALTEAAHARGIRVLMDLVANHVHEDSPLWSLHKDWFHATPILCGDDDNWTKHPIDCWFQPYLPDLDFRNLDALKAVTDAAVAWAVAADLDGFRVDAVKHMIHDFGRTLRHKTRTRLETTGIPFYLVGETFDGTDKIKEYISDVELHGQFDFPLYWVVLGAFARDQTGLCAVADALEASLAAYGPDAVMSRFLGNHDVPRFLSHAAGQIPSDNPNDPAVKWLGWNDPPQAPASEDPYRRLVMAFAFLMTVPGVPLVYYGDEVGMPGAADPDNRRPMTFEGLAPVQEWVRTSVGLLAGARRDHPAARAGEFRRLVCEAEALAYALTVPGDMVVAAFARGTERTLTLDLSGLPGMPGTLTDVLSGQTVAVTAGKVQVTVSRLGVRVLVP